MMLLKAEYWNFQFSEADFGLEIWQIELNLVPCNDLGRVGCLPFQEFQFKVEDDGTRSFSASVDLVVVLSILGQAENIDL